MSDTKIIERPGETKPDAKPDTKARSRLLDGELAQAHGDIHELSRILKDRLADPSVSELKKAAIRAELRKLADKCDSKCEAPAHFGKQDGGKPVQA